MTLILRPIGRGNWAPLQLDIPRTRKELPLLPIEARKGVRLDIAGRTFRIAKVIP